MADPARSLQSFPIRRNRWFRHGLNCVLYALDGLLDGVWLVKNGSSLIGPSPACGGSALPQMLRVAASLAKCGTHRQALSCLVV